MVKMANHKSAMQKQEVVTNIILDEIEKGRYVVCDDWQPNIISPLGLVSKSDGGYRLIHDCSLPYGHAVNDITIEMEKQSYESVDTAVGLMTYTCFMAKVDIKAAYRAVAIHHLSNLSILEY